MLVKEAPRASAEAPLFVTEKELGTTNPGFKDALVHDKLPEAQKLPVEKVLPLMSRERELPVAAII